MAPCRSRIYEALPPSRHFLPFPPFLPVLPSFARRFDGAFWSAADLPPRVCLFIHLKGQSRRHGALRDMPPFSSLPAPSPRQSNVLQKADRDGSRRPSPSSLSPTGPGGGGASSQRRIGPAAGANGDVGGPVRSRPPRLTIDTTNIAPPVPGYPHSGAPRLALNDVNAPCIGSPASVDSCKMLGRTAATPVNGHSANNNPNQLALPVNLPPGQQSEASIVHQHIQEISNKRISTLDYLRKA